MANKQLRTALVEQLRDIYWAEKKLVDSIPKLVDAAENQDLAKGLTEHLEETRGQVKRLERVFAALDLQPRAEACDAMKGLVEEADGILDEHEAGTLRDALIIAAAQKVEHYEIATYGTLCQWAEVLELDDVKSLLGENLQEEEAADKKLTSVARKINEAAATA
jgi:ferritin-like metal-binding protein YciE